MYIRYNLVGGWTNTGGLLLTGDSGTNLELTTSPCFLPLTRTLEPLNLMSLLSIPEPINLHRTDKNAASIFLSGFMSGLIMSPLAALELLYSTTSASKARANLTSMGHGLGLAVLYLPSQKQSIIE